MAIKLSATEITFNNNKTQGTAFYLPMQSGTIASNPDSLNVGLTLGFYAEILKTSSLLAGTYLFMYNACFLCSVADNVGNAQYVALIGSSGQGPLTASLTSLESNKTIGIVKVSPITTGIQYTSITKYVTLTIAAGAVSLYMTAPTGKVAMTSESEFWAWRLK